jgi:DNA oxidative demethylase
MMLLEGGEGTRRALDLGAGAVVLGGFARHYGEELVRAVAEVADAAPFRIMHTPGGQPMSVGMTNCGTLGWVSDAAGYRYSSVDPATGRPWPSMPPILLGLAGRAAEAAGYGGFVPDACLVNRYAPGSRLTLHQDRNERTMEHPIVSVSIGLPAVFLWGGGSRTGRPRRVPLLHGDVLVWGGPSRLNYHGVDVLPDGLHPATGVFRYNLTLRRAG